MEVLDVEFVEMPDKPMNEIYQTVEMKFAFLSKDNKQVYVFARCRDFLHDIVRSSLIKEPMSIYGCSYDPNNHPAVNFDEMSILVRSETVTSEAAIEQRDIVMNHAVALINHYEEMAGIEGRTSVARYKKSRKGSTWLFTGPQFWLTSPFFVSLYTMLIRLGDKKIAFTDNDDLRQKLKKISQTMTDNDARYLATIWEKIDVVVKNHEVVKNGQKFDAAYRKGIEINRFHNHGGIVSLVSCSSCSDIKNERMKKLFAGEPIEVKHKKEGGNAESKA